MLSSVLGLLLAMAPAAPVPEPAAEEARPLAPAEHEWDARSGALLSGGVAAASALSSSHAIVLGVLRAGMHSYGFEWGVGGGIGAALGPEEGLAFELLVAPGGRVPLGGRWSALVRGTVGVLSMPAGEDERDTGFALGLEAGVDFALDRFFRLEAVLLSRAATGLEEDGSTALFGIAAGVTAIP